MDTTRALDQIAEIHRQMAKGEVYRGYRSLPVAISGLIGLIAAWLQPAGLGVGDPMAFVFYWTAIAAAAAFVGTCEILYNYAVQEDTSARRRTRKVVGQFMPAIAAGAAITICFAHLSGALVPLLPGVWAICYGIGIFSCRPYLPRASGWIALFYCSVGCALLWRSGVAPLSTWSVGGTFGAGQLLAAAALWWNLERT